MYIVRFVSDATVGKQKVAIIQVEVSNIDYGQFDPAGGLVQAAYQVDNGHELTHTAWKNINGLV